MRQLDDGGQGVGGPQRHGAGAHGLVGDARAAGEQGSVGQEGDPAPLAHGLAQRPVVLQRGHVHHEALGPLAGQVEGGGQGAGQVPADDAGGLVPLNGPAPGGQGHAGADLNGPLRRRCGQGADGAAGPRGVGAAGLVRADVAGAARVAVASAVRAAVGRGDEQDRGALEDLLARGGNGQGRAPEARAQLAGEEVADGQAPVRRLQQGALGQDLQARQVGGHVHVDASGRGVGVGLDAVDVQDPALGRGVAADDRLVGGVGAAVQGAEVIDEVGQQAVARFVVVAAALPAVVVAAAAVVGPAPVVVVPAGTAAVIATVAPAVVPARPAAPVAAVAVAPVVPAFPVIPVTAVAATLPAGAVVPARSAAPARAVAAPVPLMPVVRPLPVVAHGSILAHRRRGPPSCGTAYHQLIYPVWI